MHILNSSLVVGRKPASVLFRSVFSFVNGSMLICSALVGCMLLGGVLVGCNKESAEDESTSGEKSAEGEEARPEPYAGGLSHDRFEGVAEMVTPFDSWAEGLAKIEAQLGKVTSVEGQKHYWAYADDEKCTYFYMSKDDEGEYQGEKGKAIVGTIASPSTVSLNEPYHVWSECFGWAGREIPVDPDAPLPPEDGSSVAVKDMIAGVAGAPSKWIDQEVTVTGVLNSTSRTKQEGKVVTVIVSVGHSADELMTTVGCRLKDLENVPTDDVMQKTPVQASGIVDPSMGGMLDECVVTVQDADDGDDSGEENSGEENSGEENSDAGDD